MCKCLCASVKACSSWRVFCRYAPPFPKNNHLYKAFEGGATRESCFRLPSNTGRWLNGCNVYSCPLWPHCVLCCMSIHPKHHCDPSQTLLMDIHALPQLPWTHTYCILLLRRSDEFTWSWFCSGRCSIGEKTKGAKRSWIAAHYIHRRVNLSEERRMKRHE